VVARWWHGRRRDLCRGSAAGTYNYVDLRMLTKVESALLGTDLSEFHPCYRTYSVAALREVASHSYSDGFHSDAETIIELCDQPMRIREIPIPTTATRTVTSTRTPTPATWWSTWSGGAMRSGGLGHCRSGRREVQGIGVGLAR